LQCFFACCMRCMPFLPQEFRSTEKQAGPHFPAYHIGPLVNEYWQVTVALDPVFIGAPDNCFGSGTNDQFFFQFSIWVYDEFLRVIRIRLKSVMGNHGAFLCEALGILLFCFKKTFRYKQRKIGILVTGFLNRTVQFVTHFFPNRITVRLDYHASTTLRILRQISFYHQFIIPFAVTLSSWS